MKRQFGKPLLATELVDKLDEGGWVVSGGHQARELGFWPKLPVVKASFLGERLMIKTENQDFEVPSDNIVLSDRWTIEIRHTFMVNQQRKKIEGGGWHEVPAVRAALRLSNPTALENDARQAREQAQREEEESKRCAAEKYEAARQEFVTKLTSEFVGKKLEAIGVRDGGLHIEFNGVKLYITLEGKYANTVSIFRRGVWICDFKYLPMDRNKD